MVEIMLNNNRLKAEHMIYTKDHKTGYLFDPWAYSDLKDVNSWSSLGPGYFGKKS